MFQFLLYLSNFVLYHRKNRQPFHRLFHLLAFYQRKIQLLGGPVQLNETASSTMNITTPGLRFLIILVLGNGIIPLNSGGRVVTHFSGCANFRPSASHGTPCCHNKNLHRCDK